LLAYTKFTFKEFRVCVRAIFAFAGVPPRHTRAAFPAGGAEHAGAGASPHQEARTSDPYLSPMDQVRFVIGASGLFARPLDRAVIVQSNDSNSL
jgi:hypothetical protein